MLYLYAITASNRIPAIPGLQAASLTAIGEGGLYAIASRHEDLRVEPSEDDLWAHENVVEELMSDGAAVLPMRFGTALPEESAVLGVLNERREGLERALERVHGAVELSVRVGIESEPDASDAGEAGPGTAYLMDRLRRERHQSEMTARVHEPLAPLARASTSWSGEPGRRLWKAAYLVSRKRVEAFSEQVNVLDRHLSEATVLCTGPWPPYSFSSGDTAQ
jgi:hypothetical protein